MSRQTVGAGILALWLLLIGWHIRREYFEPELTRLAEATLTLAPGTYFYALEMGGTSVGLASSQLDTIPEGFLLEDQMSLELVALGEPEAIVAQTSVVLSPVLTMRSFTFTLSSSAGDFFAEGEVEGDTLLRVRIEGPGGPEPLTFRLPEAPLLGAALPIRLAKGGELREGRQLRLSVFDPSTLALRSVEIEVMEQALLTLPDSAVRNERTGRWEPIGARPLPAWRVRESYGGISIESWIDEDGRVIRSSSPLGFSIERMPYDLALQARDEGRTQLAGGAASDLILQTAIASNVDLGAVEAHEELRFLLSGIDLAGFDLAGGRQELRGDTLIVRRERWESIDPGYELPYPRMDLREALEPEPLIQSGDPRIARMARQAGGIRDFSSPPPRVVAERLNRAVFMLMEKEISLTIPSALHVLETLRGDCNEHTVLFVALARSVGLPARSAVGLVYLEGSFYYHAWPEVWLGEWVALDPTFGQLPADAAHLRFVTGGLSNQMEIARLIGSLRIEVLVPA